MTQIEFPTTLGATTSEFSYGINVNGTGAVFKNGRQVYGVPHPMKVEAGPHEPRWCCPGCGYNGPGQTKGGEVARESLALVRSMKEAKR